jgi:hypothetical protein
MTEESAFHESIVQTGEQIEENFVHLSARKSSLSSHAGQIQRVRSDIASREAKMEAYANELRQKKKELDEAKENHLSATQSTEAKLRDEIASLATELNSLTDQAKSNSTRLLMVSATKSEFTDRVERSIHVEDRYRDQIVETNERILNVTQRLDDTTRETPAPRDLKTLSESIELFDTRISQTRTRIQSLIVELSELHRKSSATVHQLKSLEYRREEQITLSNNTYSKERHRIQRDFEESRLLETRLRNELQRIEKCKDLREFHLTNAQTGLQQIKAQLAGAADAEQGHDLSYYASFFCGVSAPADADLANAPCLAVGPGTDGRSPQKQPKPPAISVQNLHVTHDQLETLRRGGIPVPFPLDVFRGVDSRLQPPDLIILNKVWGDVWRNADPDEPDTHLKNVDVESRLINEGLTRNKAKTGATFIRAECARKGRKAKVESAEE